MAQEIERKFLVSGEDWRRSCGPGASLRQAYLVALNDRSVRVRIIDGREARLTIKLGGAGLVRDEFEYPIPLADAEQLIANPVGIVIEKTRYRLPQDRWTWEIDVFAGALAGLRIAEIELASPQDQPSLPSWLGREVTGEAAFTNQSLALAGHPLVTP